MISNFLIFILISVLVVFSVLGYGLFFSKLIIGDTRFLNLPIKGIFGIFAIYLISSITHIFYPHNFAHNIFLHFLGILIFVYYFYIHRVKKKNLIQIFYFFLFLFLGFLIAKTNEDFSYYHLPNSLHFTEYKLQFGLGNLNHGFKHFSSLFLINSVFYFPFLEFYLFNITNFLFQIFFFSSLIIYLYDNNVNNFSKVFLAILFLTYLVKFNRLSEYGADFAGQFLVILSFVVSSFLFQKKKFNFEDGNKLFTISLLLIVFSITTKFIYVIYSIIPLSIFFFNYKFNLFLRFIFNIKFVLISLVSLMSIFLFNFSSTGCLVYPVSFTCLFKSFDWSLTRETISYLNLHYEAWSKAGKGAGYSLTNLEEYVSGINWIGNWVHNYFFTKVSDFIFVVLIVSTVFIVFYRFNLRKKFNLNFNFKPIFICYLFVTCVFIFWFFNFPTLRYAGYSILYLLISMPICYFISKYLKFDNLTIKKKFKYLLISALIIFNLKNIHRINTELNYSTNEHHNFNNFPFFWVDDVKYKNIKINKQKISVITNNKHCWNTPPTCLRNEPTNLDIKNKKGYIFYYLR